MNTPTAQEVASALAEAERLRTHDLDANYLAKVLLSYHYRVPFLLEVLRKTAIYLHSGQGAHEHAELVRAIEKAAAALDAGSETWDVKPW